MGLTGSLYHLAVWLRDAALAEKEVDLAIRAGMAAIKASPVLENYQRLEAFAGECWPELREEVLKHLRETDNWGSSGKVDIFLHEGLMDDALAAVHDSWNYDLVARVVEAATPTRPLAVIPICKRQAESIMDAGKADRYHHAARWVERARDAYRVAGQETEWQAYKNHLLDLHQRKYKLRPMLEDL